MKILAFVDIHCSKPKINRIINLSAEADILVCAGDVSNFSTDLMDAGKMLSKSKKKILIIPGNHEDENGIIELCSRFDSFINIHKRIFIIGDYAFLGYGGGGFSIVDKNMEIFFNSAMKSKNLKGKKIIVITHASPCRTRLDFLPWIGFVGCRSINNIIKNLNPILHICGHLHENANKRDMICNTLSLNPGHGMIVKV